MLAVAARWWTTTSDVRPVRNPRRRPTTTTDNTPVADFFGGVQSEFDLSQPAIQAFADEATNQELEVELDGAIEVTYVDDPADSAFDPQQPGPDL